VLSHKNAILSSMTFACSKDRLRIIRKSLGNDHDSMRQDAAGV